MTAGPKKTVSKKEALNFARRLVKEAVEGANKAGIASESVVAPYCPETAVEESESGNDDSTALKWCGVPVIIDKDIDELFEMPEFNDDLEQGPAFLVTQATADLVRADFERYEQSLQRMAKDWQEEKNHFMREQAHKKIDDDKSAKRSGRKHRE